MSILLPFQLHFLYWILWFGLRVNHKGDQMPLGCVRERREVWVLFCSSKVRKKMIFHLYKCFSAVGKKFCSCRALDKQFQLTWFTLILKCLGHFWSFTDKICFRKLIFPSWYWLLAGLGKNNLFILLAAHCFQTELHCNLFLYTL